MMSTCRYLKDTFRAVTLQSSFDSLKCCVLTGYFLLLFVHNKGESYRTQ